MFRDIDETLVNSIDYARSHLIEGRVASYIPELAKADPANLGACIITKEGNIYKAGDSNIPFTMQSISKTFALILALQTAGYDKVFSKVGMEPTGDKFDSIIQLETKTWYPFNPMINAGAITVVSLIESDKVFDDFLELVKKLCGNKKIRLNDEVYQSEKATGKRNWAIAYLLQSDKVLEKEPEYVLDIYFKMCSVMITAEDLAYYGMILANDGVDIFTNERVLESWIVRIVNTLMLICGMYDESGEYAVKVGIPSKSGVGGGIVASVKDVMGIGTFGPVLNEKGNSVGGECILEHLSKKYNLHIL